MRFRRNIEIEFQQERKYSEPQLNQTPYISAIDLVEEYVTLTNPQNVQLSIENYTLTDGKKIHVYLFPKDSFIPANGTLNVYTCPGKVDNIDKFVVPFVLWVNLDGTLRKKEVMNNDHCTMRLCDTNNQCIASCTASSDNHRLSISRKQEETYFLPAIRFGLTGQLILGYLRLVSLLAMLFCCATLQPVGFIILHWMSFGLDVIARGDNTGLHGEAVITKNRIDSLCVLGDRLHSLILYGAVLHQYYQRSVVIHTEESAVGTAVTVGMLHAHPYLFLPGGYMFAATVLDFCAHVLSGHTSYIQRLQASSYTKLHDFYEMVHTFSPELLAFITIGSEYYMLLLYTQMALHTDRNYSLNGINSADDIALFFYVFVGYFSALAFIARQVQNVSQIVYPEPPPQPITHHATTPGRR